MLDALEESFPRNWTWSRPEGGMFLWAEGPEGTDIADLYEKALARNVAFVPGEYFFARPEKCAPTMRLNFTNAGPEELKQAVRILGELISS
jgi:2-aminoadipate transaminase